MANPNRKMKKNHVISVINDISTTLSILILISFDIRAQHQGAAAACGLRGHMRSRVPGRHGPRVPRRLFGNMEQLNPSLGSEDEESKAQNE